VNTLDCKPDSVCLVQVRGDSMKPTFNETDLLLLDMRTTSSRSEGVYVIQLKGALLVKRLRFKLSGVVDVISDNVKYGIESLTSDEVDRLTIIGRVVWHGAKF
jgi:phage repressor protein C with HTH and peptisase S24 domain